MKKKFLLSSRFSALFSVFLFSLSFFSFTQARAAPASDIAGLPDLATLVEKTGPAVVNIRTIEKRQNRASQASEAERQLQDYLFRFFGVPQPGSPGGRPQPAPEVRRGMGSGFLTSSDGYILTNSHVVENADEVYVRLTDNREFTARLIGSDARTDVALLKIDGKNLPYLKLGKSANIRAGEWVVAIGSPFALDNTVTAGIISAKARETGDYLPLIQTDVAVNPGNSGGPLINMQGEVIGINSQIYSRSGGYMGISFAIPIDEAIRVSEQLKTSGRVTRGRIGVQIGEIPAEVAKALNLPEKQGVQVSRVDSGSAAEKGGLLAGDIILAFNGKAIKKIGELPRLIGESQPRTQIRLTVWRKGTTHQLNVTVEAVDEVASARKSEQVLPDKKQAGSSENILGMAVADLPERQKSQLQIKGGVYVAALNQFAAASGLRRGDVIVRVNDTDIKNASQFQAVVAALDRKKTVVLLVQRNDLIFFVPLKPLS
ncbi:DegQ family serine endoprotease [Oxalobacter sp. OttesenSCG-928-P03]|nr:DegQ family serine endoprotease [Oxalobacter sp. OttesenSCG-928-P03]